MNDKARRGSILRDGDTPAIAVCSGGVMDGRGGSGIRSPKALIGDMHEALTP